MMYYEVYVASQRYHKATALTYSFELPLIPGDLVEAPLQNDLVVGFVVRSVSKPKFATKPLKRHLGYRLPQQLLELHSWLIDYYPSSSGVISQLFIPSSIAAKPRAGDSTEAINITTISLPQLTEDQNNAINDINKAFPKSILLHGDTGTGKTRIYQELVKKAFRDGKSAIVLTPEIGLTPQLILNFEKTFPGQVVTVHSTLTNSQRRDAWIKIATAEHPLVIIGPRSALFSPINHLGLIVVDEAHDAAYKQEQSPYYQATRVAGHLAELHSAQLILGSATPNISDYYAFDKKKLPIIRITESAVKNDHITKVQVIDLKDKKELSKSPWISDKLISAINESLQQGKQSLVFLNRRGTARLVLCQDCGWQALCPKCDLPFTFHADSHSLICHTCGTKSSVPTTCESCGLSNILFRSIGTKALTTELAKLFPEAKIQRFDSDSTKDERFENNYEAVLNGKVDILVGTQMLSKGLDLPKLSVVGVVIADTSLYFPDYTAEEKTYQMITQVTGRVGRGHGTGNIIIQTYSPDSPSIKCAVQKNYAEFYQKQLEERKSFSFPPFCHILKITCARKTQVSVIKAATGVAESISKTNTAVTVVGPSPCFSEKQSGEYRWQLIIKSKQRQNLLKIIQALPSNCTYDLDPSNLL